jgi:hypothetical protein
MYEPICVAAEAIRVIRPGSHRAAHRASTSASAGTSTRRLGGPGSTASDWHCWELAALAPTLAVQVRQHAHGRPIRVLGDRPSRSSFPILVGGFWSVSESLRPPEHASKPAWHPDFAAPRFLVTIGHPEPPFGLADPKSPCSGVATEICNSPPRPRPRTARSSGRRCLSR